jgi:DNA-binding NarL/FixJ family response regulator
MRSKIDDGVVYEHAMRAAPPELPGAQLVDSPLDRALALLLAGEREAALRWSAAVVQHDASVPSAVILTCRLLADAGRTEAAIEGFQLGVKRAIDTGNLPLAVAAVGDLKMLGVDVSDQLDEIAGAFSLGETYREIGARLGIAPNTVRRHLGNISEKLGISSKVELDRMLADDR